MFLVLWIIVGGKDHRFVGVAPLFDPNQPLPENPFLPEPLPTASISTRVNPPRKKVPPPPRKPVSQPLFKEPSPAKHQVQVPTVNVEPFPDDHPDLPTESIGESLAEITEYLDREAGQPSSTSGINATPIIPSAVISGQDPTNQGLFTNLRYRPQPTKPCKRSKGEAICCQTLEQIYGVPFDRIRPNWLKNPETGMNLELDCYNDDLRLAVEYNGIQHYVWPNFTGQSYEDFVKQVRRDRFKVDTCDANGVYLITVPYNVPHELIPRYIQWYLPEAVAARREISSG